MIFHYPKINLKVPFLIICCFNGTKLFAQTPKSIEQDLLASYKKIEYLYDKNDYEGVASADKVFGTKLKAYSEKYSATLTRNFPLLRQESIDISTTGDGLFRIYSWDTWTGGTMHFFESVFQYRVKNHTAAILDTPKHEGDVRPNYCKLYMLKAGDKTYYLAVYKIIGSTKDLGGGIQVFEIENGRLNESAKIIKTQSGLHSYLDYYYDLSKSSGKLMPSGYVDIHFNTVTKTIYIPLIETNGAATKRYITYKFTGKYFEKIKS